MRRNNAVSQVVGFILTFVIISAAVATVIYSTSVMINQRLNSTTRVVAQSIANAVADAVTEAIAVRQNYPEAIYHRVIEIPKDINGKSYYIEGTHDYIYVNTSDGISVKAPTYNQKELAIGIIGKVRGEAGKISIDCNKTTSILKIDFGRNNSYTSPGAFGYRRITYSSSEDLYDNNGNEWWDPNYQDWLYRVPIIISNLNSYTLYNFQVRVILHPTNIAYKVIRRNATDIRFAEVNGTPIPYWIEKWEFNGLSYIWLNISKIPPGNKKIYMYCGYRGSTPISSESNGSRVFDFFDDFSSTSIDSNKWTTYGSEAYIDNGYLVLKNGSAVASNKVFSNGIMEAKAMAVDLGANNTEASMFVRSTSLDDPYNNAFVFSSGSFKDYPERNFSIGTSYSNLYYITTNPMKSQVWYRLTMTFSGSNFTATRYYYHVPSIPETIKGAFSVSSSGYVGLHTTLQGCMAKYDWVFVRKVADVQPTALVDGIVCSIYRWSYSSIGSLSFFNLPSENFTDPLHDDWVSSNDTSTFVVGPIQNGIYSIVFNFGDRYQDVNASVYINDDLVFENISCKAGAVETRLSIIEVSNNYINITLVPKPPRNRWALTSLEIEKGIRSVILGGG